MLESLLGCPPGTILSTPRVTNYVRRPMRLAGLQQEGTGAARLESSGLGHRDRSHVMGEVADPATATIEIGSAQGSS